MAKSKLDGFDKEHRSRFVAERRGISRQWARYQWNQIANEGFRADRRLFPLFNKVSRQMSKEGF